MLSFPFASSEAKTKESETPPVIPFDALVAVADSERTAGCNGVLEHYKKVVEDVHDEDARELVQALVFLATRSHEESSAPVTSFSEFPPVPSETKI